jgi:MarR family transcriptional regulator, organic hydroperoxide resistance regulator
MRRSKSKRAGERPGKGREIFPWSQSVGYQLRDTYKAFAQVMKQELDHLDINFGGWPYLRILWREDGLTQRELTHRSGLMQPNTNAALKQLSKRGLIIQKVNPHDRRRINIYLTPQGRAIGQHLVPLALRVRERALAGIKRKEFLLLLDLLARMKTNLNAGDQIDAGRETRPRKSKSTDGTGHAGASRKPQAGR